MIWRTGDIFWGGFGRRELGRVDLGFVGVFFGVGFSLWVVFSFCCLVFLFVTCFCLYSSIFVGSLKRVRKHGTIYV